MGEREEQIQKGERCLILLTQEEACLREEKNLQDTRQRLTGLETWFENHGQDGAETGEAGSGESIPAVVRGKGSACDQSAFSGIGAVSGFAGTFGSRR